MLVPGKPFQPSLMFVGKARSLPERELVLVAPLGYAPALLANIRPDRKDWLEANTLAYLASMLRCLSQIF